MNGNAPGGRVLPYKRLMRVGSHFHDWVDHNGVAFSIELLEWSRAFSGVRQFLIFTVRKRTRMFVLQMKSKVFFIQSKKWVNS